MTTTSLIFLSILYIRPRERRERRRRTTGDFRFQPEARLRLSLTHSAVCVSITRIGLLLCVFPISQP
jgi:hypothetical protein